MKNVYLDHAATSPMHPDVICRMTDVMNNYYGNPSSLHQFGRATRKIIDDCRRIISREINAQPQEVIFTSGGTESNNIVLRSVTATQKHLGKHMITTAIEHPSVLDTYAELEKEGWQVTYLPVSEQGAIAIEDLIAALTDETILVSIMAVNNETGVLQPIDQVASVLADHQSFFHVDSVQAFGRSLIDVVALGVDFLTASAHKINGPKGAGLLYVKNGTPLVSLTYGGEQERNRRAGTENVAGVSGFAKAVEVYQSCRAEYSANAIALREAFLSELQDIDYWLNTDLSQSSPHILNVSFPNVCQESLLTNLDLAGIAVSSGSACSAGSVSASHVMVAMFGEGNDRSNNSVRISFGLGNTVDEVKWAAQEMKKIVKSLQ